MRSGWRLRTTLYYQDYRLCTSIQTPFASRGMWSLNDYKTIQTMGSTSYLSYKVQTEYDCAKERTRKLASTFFSGNMGSGVVVYSISNEGKWLRVESGSLGQSEWEVACDKE